MDGGATAAGLDGAGTWREAGTRVRARRAGREREAGGGREEQPGQPDPPADRRTRGPRRGPTPASGLQRRGPGDRGKQRAPRVRILRLFAYLAHSGRSIPCAGPAPPLISF